MLGSQRGKTRCGLSCNPVPSLAPRSPGSGFCPSRTDAHAFTQLLQTLLRKFNFPAPAHWDNAATAPTSKGWSVVLQSFAYGVPSMPVGGRPKKGIERVRPAQPKRTFRCFDFLMCMMRNFLLSQNIVRKESPSARRLS